MFHQRDLSRNIRTQDAHDIISVPPSFLQLALSLDSHASPLKYLSRRFIHNVHYSFQPLQRRPRRPFDEFAAEESHIGVEKREGRGCEEKRKEWAECEKGEYGWSVEFDIGFSRCSSFSQSTSIKGRQVGWAIKRRKGVIRRRKDEGTKR